MSDVVRRRIAVLLLAAGIVLGVLALAGEGPFEAPGPTEEDRVAATVEALYGAAAAGEYEDFCALLTDRARRTLRANASRLTGDDVGCTRALELTLGEVLEDSEVAVEEVSVSGPRARVAAELRPARSRPELRTVYLEEIEGDWLVTDPG